MMKKRERGIGAWMLGTALAWIAGGAWWAAGAWGEPVAVNTATEPMTPGKFLPTWESLKQYEAPAWFRDAKFGVWSVWGPQSVPEQGDWYARQMYIQGHRQNVFHVATYGPPSQFGYKDILPLWKAEKWDPARLMALYKRAGARYFMVMVNHHDNFDLWDSRYQPWNSVAIGPKRNILGEWAAAAQAEGLRLGVSIHAAHAWTWYEPAQGADKTGPFAGVPYDGKLRLEDSQGKWWQGLDPQALYAQDHPLSASANIDAMWDWSHGACPPSQGYCDNFYNRTLDVVHRYHPDVLYFDDTVLPLYPVSDAELKIAADFYNSNMREHGGKLEGVLTGKGLSVEQRQTMVWDIERGQTSGIEPQAWQTDTCVGDWFYRKGVHYKSAQELVCRLADVVSKNGNLLLNAPLSPEGTLDEEAEKTLTGIGEWLAINGEAIYGTRPWKVFGEGPTAEKPAGFKRIQGFNEGVKYGVGDVRFTASGEAVYAMVLGVPEGAVRIRLMGVKAGLLEKPVRRVELLGSGERVEWSQEPEGLVIQPVKSKWPSGIAEVFKITG
jgi:alpha-L-fucosidase